MFNVEMLKETEEEYLACKQKEKEFEWLGQFNDDVDNVTFQGTLPVTKDYPYIKRGIKNKAKELFYGALLWKTARQVNNKLINLRIEGKQNLKGVKGAIITCNHISKVDFFPIRQVYGRKLKFVAADFNNWDNLLGKVARNTGYIPIPTNLNLQVMRKFNEAIEFYLSKHKKILIYPEQAMWREEARPRPLKNGAFYYAVKNNVPIVPMFITFTPKQKMVENGKRNFSNYTLHILPPIEINNELTEKQNIESLKRENYRLWQQLYEQTYNTKLKFTTKNTSGC